MSEYKGREYTYYYNDTKIGDLKSVSLAIDGNTIDISDDDSGDWAEFLAGRKSWTLDITTNYTPASGSVQKALADDFIENGSSGTSKFAPATPVSGDVSYTGTTIVTNFGVDRGDSDGVIECSISLQGSGALSQSVEA